jgi:hypothetical protein
MLWSGLRMRRFLRPALAGPALGALSLLAILALLQRSAPLFVNLGAGDEAFARGFRAWERDGLRASGETMFRWALDGAVVELPVRVVSGSVTARLRLARFTDRPADIILLSSGRAVDEWTQPPRGWRERTVELGEVRGAPTLQIRTTPEDPEALGIALDWIELRGAGRVLPTPRLLGGLLCLFVGVPLALSLLAGPAPALGAVGAAAVIGAALVTWDRLGGIWALGAAGVPTLVAAALAAGLFRLLARRWPDTVAGAGERALTVPAAALVVALAALSHPSYYYPDVDTHARYLAAARADPYLLFDPGEYQDRTGAWTREIAGRRVAFPYSPVFHVVAWPLAVVFGEVAAIKTAAVVALALTLLLVHAVARLLGLGARAALLAQALAASLPVLSSRLALALFPTLLGQALELLLIVHLMRRYTHLEGARDAAAACAFFFAAQASYTGSMLNVSAVVVVFAGWELLAGDRHRARRVLGAWAIAAAAVVLLQYARFVPVFWREVLPHLRDGTATVGDEAGSLVGRAARRAATFYDLVYPLLLVPGLVALRGAPRAPRRLVASALLAGVCLLALRYGLPVLFRDAKEVELLAAPVAVTAAAGAAWLDARGAWGRLAAAAAAGIALAWGAQRAVAVYLDRFVAVGR